MSDCARQHYPGEKIVLELVVSVAVGGACAADLAMLRGEPDVFDAVASDPTVSRLIPTLARRMVFDLLKFRVVAETWLP